MTLYIMILICHTVPGEIKSQRYADEMEEHLSMLGTNERCQDITPIKKKTISRVV